VALGAVVSLVAPDEERVSEVVEVAGAVEAVGTIEAVGTVDVMGAVAEFV